MIIIAHHNGEQSHYYLLFKQRHKTIKKTELICLQL